MQFFNVSFRLNLEQFFPNDLLVYDVFGLFQCKLSKADNLLLFHRNTDLLDISVFSRGARRTKYHLIFFEREGKVGLKISLVSDNIRSEGYYEY